MIDPVNLLKVDNIINTNGKIFNLDFLPEYDIEDYSIEDDKEFEKYVKDIERSVRNSFEYKEFIYYIKTFCNMNYSGLNPNLISNPDSKIKIEIHHTPFTLYDIVKIVISKRKFFNENLSLEMVAKEVMELHYRQVIGLYPLSKTEHELVHAGYLFIPVQKVLGRYDIFRSMYNQFMDKDLKDTLDNIEEFSKSCANDVDQFNILQQSNIYIDAKNVYSLPIMSKLLDRLQYRVNEIKDNMYTLPKYEPKEKKQAIHFMKEALIF